MTPALRRILVVEAHRRATGDVAVMLHSLGTGESFAIHPHPGGGFADETSGITVPPAADGVVEADGTRLEVAFRDRVLFDARDLATGERVSGRAGGGATVTLYEGDDFFQFNVVAEG